ncbi:MAG: putative 4-mercaptohistidine N1-methyltransferase [Akkermansiaceae bacterium]
MSNSDSVYEDSTILDEYLLFHYGEDSEILTGERSWPEGMVSALGFAKRTPSHFQKTPVARGLDLGCAVGRSSFEMAKHCEHVVGLDFSHAFIDAANQLKGHGSLPYSRRDEGNMGTSLVAERPDDIEASRLEFIQGDAMSLREEFKEFDRVHAANLLCRLTDPDLLLQRLPSLVRSGGELVLATPCTWLEGFTPRSNWPKADTLSYLKESLSNSFDLILKDEEPFLIRETSRKFQWTSSMLTVWKRT